MPVPLLLAVVLAVALPVGATESPAPSTALRLPTSSLESAFRRERASGAERSETLARAVVHLAVHAPPERRGALLELAARLDPRSDAPLWEQVREAVRRGDVAGAGSAFVEVVRTVRSDAALGALWARRAVHAAHLLLTAVLATLGALLVLRAFPLARHTLGGLLGSGLAGTVALVALPLAALQISPLVSLVAALIAFAPFLSRRERLSLALPCLALAALDVALPSFAPSAMLLDPSSRTALVARACEQAPDPETAARLEALAREPQRPPSGALPSEIELGLGLQARRRGDADGARAHFVACLRADSTCAAAYVNLANQFFRAGQFERAAAGYRAAAALEPASSLPHANLAQTYIRMLHYEEADRELRAATSLGFESLSRRRAAWRDESLPVLDMSPSAAGLRRLARREAHDEPARTRALLQAWRASAWQGLRLDVSPWILGGLALLLLLRLEVRALVCACPTCGAVCCAHCVAVAESENPCTTCQPARTRPAPRTNLEALDAAPVKRRRPGRSAYVRAVAILFPGAADVVRGAPFAALAAALVAWAALLGLHAAIEAARLQSPAWPAGLDAAALRGAAVLVGLAWLPGLVRLRVHERRPSARRAVQPAGA
jgi:tetratricopeptide (TPR) repeat protein